jgi:hypothetical protein
VWNPLAAWPGRVANDLDPPAQLILDPTLTLTGVPLINPQVLDARKLISCAGQ